MGQHFAIGHIIAFQGNTVGLGKGQKTLFRSTGADKSRDQFLERCDRHCSLPMARVLLAQGDFENVDEKPSLNTVDGAYFPPQGNNDIAADTLAERCSSDSKAPLIHSVIPVVTLPSL